MIKAVNALCEVLLLMHRRPEDALVAVSVTSAMQRFVKCKQQHVPPMAPAYPREWLSQRAMQCVCFFQDPKIRLEQKWTKRMTVMQSLVLTDMDVAELTANKTWWQLAKESIQCWFDCKFVHLQVEDERQV